MYAEMCSKLVLSLVGILAVAQVGCSVTPGEPLGQNLEYERDHDLASVVCLAALAVELYHLIQHVLILSTFKVLAPGDQTKEPAYAIFDSAGVFLALAVHRQYMCLAVLHALQHAYYYIAWNSPWTTRAMTAVTCPFLNWNSKQVVRANEVGQTVFDIFVHAVNVAVLLKIHVVDNHPGSELMLLTMAVVFCCAVSIRSPKLAVLRHPWLK